jgi:hypothetical protein
MAGDDPVIDGNQRENGIAGSAEIVDQPRFGPLAECYLLNKADRGDIVRRFGSHHHLVTPAAI